MDITVRTSASGPDVLALLYGLPEMLAGHGPDPHHLEHAPLVHAVHKILELLEQDYHRKSEGLLGQDGEAWTPLAQRTIELRLKKGSPTSSVHGKLLGHYQGKGKLSRAAAEKKLERSIAGGDMPILIDEGPLIKSLSPGEISGQGTATEYKKPGAEFRTDGQGGGQEVEWTPGQAEITSTVPYLEAHMTGKRPEDDRDIPVRKPIPDDFPQDWADQVAEAYAEGLVGALGDVLEHW